MATLSVVLLSTSTHTHAHTPGFYKFSPPLDFKMNEFGFSPSSSSYFVYFSAASIPRKRKGRRYEHKHNIRVSTISISVDSIASVWCIQTLKIHSKVTNIRPPIIVKDFRSDVLCYNENYF